MSDIIKKGGDYMDYKKARSTFLGGMIAGVIMMLFASARGTVTVAVAACVVMAVSIGIYLLYFRCPYCNTFWDNLGCRIPKHCPECGKEIEQENY